MSTLSKSQESNESNLMIILMSLITVSVLIYNSYHMFNWLYEMHYDPNTYNIKAALMGVAGMSLAFIEIPVAILLVNSIRLKDNVILSALYILFIFFIAGVAIKAGMSSQTTLYDKRINQVTAENDTIATINAQMTQAQNKRDLAIKMADRYQGNLNKDIIIASAKVKYSETIARLTAQRAQAYRNKTSRVNINTTTGKSSGIDTLMIFLFPAFLSIAGVVSTIYVMLHIKGKLRIAAMSMENKIAQRWNSDFIAQQMNELVVSPMSGVIRNMKEWFNADVKPNNPTPQKKVAQPYAPQTEKPEAPALTSRPVKNTFKSPAQKTKPPQEMQQTIPSAYEIMQNDFEQIKQEMLSRGWKMAGNNATPPVDISPQEMADLAKKKQAIFDRYNDRPSGSQETSKTPLRNIAPSLTVQRSSVSQETSYKTPLRETEKPLISDKEKEEIKAILSRLKSNKKAGVGTMVACVNCGEGMIKRTETHKFCSHSRKPREDGENCSNEYNTIMNKYRGEG